MVGTALVHALRLAVGDATVSDQPIDLSRFAHDASHYLLRPQAVVLRPRRVRRRAGRWRSRSVAAVGVTFRSGGTSLSGQAAATAC